MDVVLVSFFVKNEPILLVFGLFLQSNLSKLSPWVVSYILCKIATIYLTYVISLLTLKLSYKSSFKK